MEHWAGTVRTTKRLEKREGGDCPRKEHKGIEMTRESKDNSKDN